MGQSCCESSSSTATATATTESCCGGSAQTHPLGHHGAVCHVEFTVPDFQKAKEFYGPLFQWDFHPMSPENWYFMSPKGGPCGCINKGSAPTDTKTMLYVNVSDINTTLDKAKKTGATVRMPKTEIPGGHGFIAQLKAPDGNVFGLYNRN